jgi:CRP/FNR family transcriptional regulator, anaerobic regulatory protein
MMTKTISNQSTTALKLGAKQPVALRHFASEQPLFHEGDSAGHVYEIVSGNVKITKVTAGGRELVLDFHASGDIIGLTLHGNFAYSAIAIDAVTARCMPRQRLQAGLDSESETESALQRLALAYSQIEALQTHLLHVSLLDPRGRLAAFLCTLGERQGRKTNLHLPMTQRDIAAHLALTPETVCRVLRQFREAGWIKMPSGHSISLENRAALLQLANDDAG